jgi:transcriptional regulator with XRE-family HTH domain
VSQGLLSGYERGRLRMNVGVVVAFAKALNVSSDEILGLKKTRQNGYFDRRFVRRLRRMSKLSQRDKEALAMMIDAFINKCPPMPRRRCGTTAWSEPTSNTLS